MRVRKLLAALAAAALGAAGAHSFSAPEGALIDYFLVQYPSISPNGDGIRDSSLIRVGIADTCSTLRLTLEDDGGTPLDTLLEQMNAAPGTISAVWDGMAAGVALGEGTYRLRLAASLGTLVETDERIVILDLTAPLVRVERIEPGIYAPGVPGTADTVLVYFSIERYGAGDTLSMTIINPAAASERRAIPISGDGLYRAAWTEAPTASDGIYRAAFVAADESGNASFDSAAFDVDTEGPNQAFIDLPPEYTNVPPTAVTGRAYDRNGVYELALVWNGGEPFPPDSVYLEGDTLFWRFDVIDSLMDGGSFLEGRHTLASHCRDLFDGSSRHETQISTAFTLDLSAPSAPVLEQPASPSRVPTVLVRGSIEYPETKYVYLERSAATDTTVRYEPAGSTFAVSMPLARGANVIRARAEDSAANMSALSNAVTVAYEPADEIDWPEVLRGPDAFRVYSAEPARSVTVDIYTIEGARVASLAKSGPAQSFAVDWNLRNDDGEEVRNGPYLAVITVRFESRVARYKEFVAVVR